MILKTRNQQRKSTKPKRLFFEKINEIDKSLTRLTKKKKKREKIQITNIRNERRDITTDILDIKRIIKEYCEQLYAHKVDNVDEMGQFLERHNLSKLTQKEIHINNWNRLLLITNLNQQLTF